MCPSLRSQMAYRHSSQLWMRRLVVNGEDALNTRRCERFENGVSMCWPGSSWKPGCWNEAANRRIIDYSIFSACTAASHYQPSLFSLDIWSLSASATVWEKLSCWHRLRHRADTLLSADFRQASVSQIVSILQVRDVFFFSGGSLPGFVGRAFAGPAS